jgi:glycosyltransferase involved in cell wall biosynthesis
LPTRIIAQLYARITERFEKKCWSKADAVAFICDSDYQAALQATQNRNLRLVADGTLDLGQIPIPNLNVSHTLIILLNKNAIQSVYNVKKFLREVWLSHEVQHSLCDFKLHITGVTPHELSELAELPERQLTNSRVLALGFVQDLNSLYSGALASISPSYVGAGLRKKVLESMAYGVPVFASELDCSSHTLFTPERNIIVLDRPQKFVDDVNELYTNSVYRESIILEAMHSVERHADWRSFGDEMFKLIQEKIVEKQN